MTVSTGITCGPFVVRLVSSGVKYMTRDGFVRDKRDYYNDKPGVEFEVELVDVDNTPARFFTSDPGLLQDLKNVVGSTVAIGWRRRDDNDTLPLTRDWYNVAWEIER